VRPRQAPARGATRARRRILEIDGRPLAEPREQPELAGVEIELGALGQTPVDAPVVLAPGERRHDPLQLGQ
jgi:hypothetical protein